MSIETFVRLMQEFARLSVEPPTSGAVTGSAMQKTPGQLLYERQAKNRNGVPAWDDLPETIRVDYDLDADTILADSRQAMNQIRAWADRAHWHGTPDWPALRAIFHAHGVSL